MFSFSAQPQQLSAKRDAGMQAKTGNLMFDPRVRRGTTVARSTGKEAETRSGGGAGATLRSTARTQRRRPKEEDVFKAKPKSAVGSDVLDLSSFLTEQDGPTASAPPTADAICQTDVFVEQKEPEQYIPSKRGVDAGAQVDVADLFDFVKESQPLVDVLADKTLEQALVELEEEAELDALFSAKHSLQEAEQARLQHIADTDTAAAAQAAQRAAKLRAARKRRQQELECRTKVISAAISRGVTRSAIASAIGGLRTRLLFADPLRSEIDAKIVTPAITAASDRVGAMRVARQLADELLRASLLRQRQLHTAEQARLEAEAARKRPYRVKVVLRGVMPPRQLEGSNDDEEDEDDDQDQAAAGEDDDDQEEGVNGDNDGSGNTSARAPKLPEPGSDVEVVLGPILVARADTAAAVEGRISQWIAANPMPVVKALMRGKRLRLAYKGTPLEPDVTLESLTPEGLGQLHLINETV